MTLTPRAVIVTRPTEYELLIAHHGTRQQVDFFLETRGRTLDEVDARHAEQEAAVRTVAQAVPPEWRRAAVTRDDLSRWLFGPEDVVVAVGQDGLVPNVAKYLCGQPVIGVNPSGAANAGVLVRHKPGAVAGLLRRVDELTIEQRSMVEIVTDAGQRLHALNEIYLGQRTHQSARWTLAHAAAGTVDVSPAAASPDGTSAGCRVGEVGEYQSCSGLLVSTGTGCTGWARSLHRERGCTWQLPSPTGRNLAWFVREAWPSPATGTTLVEGVLSEGERLRIRSSSDELVAFGDGIESDRLLIGWGQQTTIGRAAQTLALVVG